MNIYYNKQTYITESNSLKENYDKINLRYVNFKVYSIITIVNSKIFERKLSYNVITEHMIY